MEQEPLAALRQDIENGNCTLTQNATGGTLSFALLKGESKRKEPHYDRYRTAFNLLKEAGAHYFAGGKVPDIHRPQAKQDYSIGISAQCAKELTPEPKPVSRHSKPTPENVSDELLDRVAEQAVYIVYNGKHYLYFLDAGIAQELQDKLVAARPVFVHKKVMYDPAKPMGNLCSVEIPGELLARLKERHSDFIASRSADNDSATGAARKFAEFEEEIPQHAKTSLLRRPGPHEVGGGILKLIFDHAVCVRSGPRTFMYFADYPNGKDVYQRLSSKKDAPNMRYTPIPPELQKTAAFPRFSISEEWSEFLSTQENFRTHMMDMPSDINVRDMDAAVALRFLELGEPITELPPQEKRPYDGTRGKSSRDR